MSDSLETRPGLLQGKHVAITGASRGIGRAIALLFARQGAFLHLFSRGRGDLDSLAQELSSLGPAPHLFVGDVRREEELAAFFNEIRKQKCGLDALVNNAGILHDAVIQMVTPESIEAQFETNVFGVIYASQQAVKLMARHRAGSIVNMTSIIGRRGNKGQTVYGATKAAIIGFTYSLSKELAPLGIRVNAIAPGFIDTDMIKAVHRESFERNLAAIGLGRIGTPDDVARTALFLASDLSAYTTGEVLGVDGGMVL